MSKKKQTPLTVEYFHEEIIPTLEVMMKDQEKRIKQEIRGDIQKMKKETVFEIKKEVKDGLSSELETYHNDVIEFKEEVMGEIKDFREVFLLQG